jgi:AcrR family transcriptional regulator
VLDQTKLKRMTDAQAEVPDTHVGPGRPRDRTRHQAVLDATRALLREVGYSGVNIDAIARSANVSRRLIYRWWSHKAQIVAEVLFDVMDDGPAPDTGSLDQDVRALVEMTAQRYARREMALGLPGLQADIIADPDLLAEVENRYTSVHVQRWEEILGRAESRAEIGESYDHVAVAHAVVGAITVLTQERTFRRRRDLTDFVTRFTLNALR